MQLKVVFKMIGRLLMVIGFGMLLPLAVGPAIAMIGLFIRV